jgi:hypothetical protein
VAARSRWLTRRPPRPGGEPPFDDLSCVQWQFIINWELGACVVTGPGPGGPRPAIGEPDRRVTEAGPGFRYDGGFAGGVSVAVGNLGPEMVPAGPARATFSRAQGRAGAAREDLSAEPAGGVTQVGPASLRTSRLSRRWSVGVLDLTGSARPMLW